MCFICNLCFYWFIFFVISRSYWYKFSRSFYLSSFYRWFLFKLCGWSICIIFFISIYLLGFIFFIFYFCSYGWFIRFSLICCRSIFIIWTRSNYFNVNIIITFLCSCICSCFTYSAFSRNKSSVLSCGCVCFWGWVSSTNSFDFIIHFKFLKIRFK